jgi:hypothetical protein
VAKATSVTRATMTCIFAVDKASAEVRFALEVFEEFGDEHEGDQISDQYLCC